LTVSAYPLVLRTSNPSRISVVKQLKVNGMGQLKMVKQLPSRISNLMIDKDVYAVLARRITVIR
jgi:hypothetical protein